MLVGNGSKLESKCQAQMLFVLVPWPAQACASLEVDWRSIVDHFGVLEIRTV